MALRNPSIGYPTATIAVLLVILAEGLSLTPAAVANRDSASLSLAPTVGEAGDTVTVTGTGFTPSTPVEVTFGGAPVGAPVADTDGDFVHLFAVPIVTGLIPPGALAAPVEVIAKEPDTRAIVTFELTTTSQQRTIPFAVDGADSVPFHLFSVVAPGAMTAVISWTGGSQSLTASLTGRRRPGLPDPTAPYAEVTGASPLQLTYTVTEDDVRRGVGWRLVLRDGAGLGDAVGTIALETPYDATLEAAFQREKIGLRSGEHWPTAELQQTFVAKLEAPTTIGGLHGLISLDAACDCYKSDRLEQLGLDRQSFLPRRHAFGRVRKGTNLADPALAQALRGLTLLDPEDKVGPHILVGDYRSFELVDEAGVRSSYLVNADGTLNLSAFFARDVSEARIAAILATDTVSSSAVTSHLWRVKVTPADLLRLAGHDEVEWIDAGPPPAEPTSDEVRAVVGADIVHSPPDGNLVLVDGAPVYSGLTGDGITVGVHDTGIDGAHDDLDVVAEIPSTGVPVERSHGTAMAGIIAGSGAHSDGIDGAGTSNGGGPFQWRGVAPRADLVAFGTDLGIPMTDAWLQTAIRDASLDLVNHSHALVSRETRARVYSDGEWAVDRAVRGGAPFPRRPAVFSAGNFGTFTTPDDVMQPVGYFSLGQQLKNAITVGNWNSTVGDGVLGVLSSMGPTHDGRIQPDLVAPGQQGGPGQGITTTRAGLNGTPPHGYAETHGTSPAAAAVSGVVALLLEAWQKTYSEPWGTTIDESGPLPSTLRALLIHTADDIVRPAALYEEDLNGDGMFGPNEDLNCNGQLDPGEDQILNGALDHEDKNCNGRHDLGLRVQECEDVDLGLGFAGAAVGPDFATGWGLVDAVAAVELLREQREIEDGRPVPKRIVQSSVVQGQTHTTHFVVDRDGPIKVTLAWDDVESPPAAPGTERKLINDLDLVLIDPAGNSHYPWQLGQTIVDPEGRILTDEEQTPGRQIEVELPILPSSRPRRDHENIPASALVGGGVWAAKRGRDHLNNVEQVSVPDGVAGRWQARVSGFDVRQGPQSFSLVGFPYPELPDLVVDSREKVAIGPFGEDLEVTWQARNAGPVETGRGFQYELRLSTDFFADEDDPPLIQGVALPALGPGAAHEQTSEFQIAQADADALLGRSGVTLDELLATDPFILVRVDSGEVIDEHHEANVGFLQLARSVDVVLVSDRSGSMNGDIPVSTGGRKKIDLLKDSLDLFLDLMRKDQDDKVGAVSFSASNDIATDRTMTTLRSSDADLLRDAIVDPLAPGTTTDIHGGLERGLALMPTAGTDADRRRVLILFSDGEKTEGGDPADPAFLRQFTDDDIHLFTVGYGTVGGSGYAGIDAELLRTLATAGAGGFTHVTDSSLELDKFFVNAVAGAVDSEVIVDPIADLPPGHTQSVDVILGAQDYLANFVLTWDDPAHELDLSVRTPGGLVIDVGNVHRYASRARLTTGRAHKRMEIRTPTSLDEKASSDRPWQIVVHNPTGHTIRYAASAIADSTLHADARAPEEIAGATLAAGDPIPLELALDQSGHGPITGARVTAIPTRPLIGLGDLLASGILAQLDLSSIPTHLDGDPLTLVERWVLALQQQFGGDPLPRGVGEAIPLAEGTTPGTYAAANHQTGTEGPYGFVLRAEGLAADCQPVEREISETVVIPSLVDPENTVVDVTYPDPGSGGTVRLQVTPFSRTGSFLGPGWSPEITISFDGGLFVPTSTVEDGLDGSYSQSFEVKDRGTTSLTLEVLGVRLPTATYDLSLPAPEKLTPTRGASETEQKIVASFATTSFADGTDPTAILGVELLSGAKTIGLKDVRVDVRQGTATAIVPAGLEPGIYAVRFTGRSGVSPTPASAAYRVTGREGELPAYLDALVESITALLKAPSNDAGLARLGATLRAVRMTPAGPTLREKDKAAAVRELVEHIAKHRGRITERDIPSTRTVAAHAELDATGAKAERDGRSGLGQNPPGIDR